MENIINIVNSSILYMAAYTFLIVIYSITFYALIKGIVKILTFAYRQLKRDWKSLRSSKDEQ